MTEAVDIPAIRTDQQRAPHYRQSERLSLDPACPDNVTVFYLYCRHLAIAANEQNLPRHDHRIRVAATGGPEVARLHSYIQLAHMGVQLLDLAARLLGFGLGHLAH